MPKKPKIDVDDLPPWITRPQAARLAGVERNTIDYRIAHQIYPSKEVLGTLMVPTKAVLGWMAVGKKA